MIAKLPPKLRRNLYWNSVILAAAIVFVVVIVRLGPQRAAPVLEVSAVLFCGLFCTIGTLRALRTNPRPPNGMFLHLGALAALVLFRAAHWIWPSLPFGGLSLVAAMIVALGFIAQYPSLMFGELVDGEGLSNFTTAARAMKEAARERDHDP